MPRFMRGIAHFVRGTATFVHRGRAPARPALR